MSRLIEFLEDRGWFRGGGEVLSVVGLSKNSGKTTTMLAIMRHVEKKGACLALTSTGRDGEAVDEITLREKPRVLVGAGTIITTGENTLELRRGGLELLWETNYRTAVGRIVVARARADVGVVLEGPATVSEMREMVEGIIHRNGAGIVIIDGSIDRVAVATPAISGGVILASGAVLGPDIDTVVEKTRHMVGMLKIPKIEGISFPQSSHSRFFAASHDGGEWEVFPGSFISDLGGVIVEMRKGRKYIFVSGAVSDAALDEMTRALGENRGALPVIIASDATKFFISERTRILWEDGGGSLRVEHPVRLLALTVNPHNPEGTDFDPARFLSAMKERVSVPVFDVVGEEQ